MKVVYYEDNRGRQSAREFIDGLNPKMKVKTLGRLLLLEEYGERLSMPFARHLEDGIYELRIPQESDITRLLYFFCIGDRAIVTSGFVKKTSVRQGEKSRRRSATEMIGGCAMASVREHLEASLNDPAFREEWEAQEVEREVIGSIVEARLAAGLSQKELAERCGMKASNLCRLENGNGNPSVATLAKIARGLGKRLRISFV